MPKINGQITAFLPEINPFFFFCPEFKKRKELKINGMLRAYNTGLTELAYSISDQCFLHQRVKLMLSGLRRIWESFPVNNRDELFSDFMRNRGMFSENTLILVSFPRKEYIDISNLNLGRYFRTSLPISFKNRLTSKDDLSICALSVIKFNMKEKDFQSILIHEFFSLV